ncbi:class I SAM-dependent methyltransferase [Natrialbaceae archaeon A-arb3/5]
MNSKEVCRRWAERDGEYSPEYYAYYGPDKTSESVRSILARFVDRDASVLELGCSSGRHLSHLSEHGFENLYGIEVNGDAFDVMEETYPDLAADGTFYHDAIEDVVEDFDDGQFDAIYSVETLQHLHPDVDWVFEELSRITDDLLITVENEGEDDTSQPDDPDVNYVNGDFPLYYRDWNRVFTELGFVEIDATDGKRDTIRTFRSR